MKENLHSIAHFIRVCANSIKQIMDSNVQVLFVQLSVGFASQIQIFDGLLAKFFGQIKFLTPSSNSLHQLTVR